VGGEESFHTAWQAGIQHITDFIHSNIPDPGVRRGDEGFFSNLL